MAPVVPASKGQFGVTVWAWLRSIRGIYKKSAGMLDWSQFDLHCCGERFFGSHGVSGRHTAPNSAALVLKKAQELHAPSPFSEAHSITKKGDLISKVTCRSEFSTVHKMPKWVRWANVGKSRIPLLTPLVAFSL